MSSTTLRRMLLLVMAHLQFTLSAQRPDTQDTTRRKIVEKFTRDIGRLFPVGYHETKYCMFYAAHCLTSIRYFVFA